jgi:Alginate lyase
VRRTRIICSLTTVALATILSSAALISQRAQAAATGCLPSDIIDLHNWKLTLPVNNAQEITLPALYIYQSPYFSHEACTAAVFRTPIGGATTPNSSYPRTELREMTGNGTALASWSNTGGTHEMDWRVAVDSVPPAKPQVVVGQVHDPEDDVIQVLYDGTKRAITYRWLGHTTGELVSGYQLGTFVDLRIVASGGAYQLYANGALKATQSRPGSGLYFKAGDYPQSSPGRGDNPNFISQVRISRLTVKHSP